MNKFIYKVSKNLTTSQIINRKFLRKIALSLESKILDLGSGTGEYSILMAKNKNNEVFAFDSSKELCFNLRKEVEKLDIQNLKIFEGDAHKLPFKDSFFDACFCNTVLEHVKDPNVIVKEIRRVLRRKGKFIVSIPFLQEIHADPDDYRRYTFDGLRLFLEKNGFKVIKKYGDFGALNVIEFLLLGSFIWRIRLGLRKNFPFGYLYILLLMMMFFFVKVMNYLFSFLRRNDKHFATQVTMVAEKL